MNAQQKQHEIKEDIPFIVKLGKKTYKCHYLKEWVAGKISYLIAKREANPKADAQEMLKLMAMNNTLASKCVSMLILGSYWKIKLFHWYFWRKIYRNNTARELTAALATVYEALDLSFFSEYDISGSDEYIEEETDENRTETIVSRTAIGEKSSFIKEFGVTNYEYEHKISIPLRTIMCIDLPRIDYDKGKKIKKSDWDFVVNENRRLAAEREKKLKEA